VADFGPLLDNVPVWDRYLTVDELNAAAQRLAADYPERVKLLELGRSTNGEMIYCLKIGEGRHNAFVHGFPNTEEPYGGNLLTYLSRALAESPDAAEATGYTWYLVPCSDPDGARLNEGFQRGPLTPLNFCLNYYRTPHSITPDGCFPFRYGPLDLNSPPAETRALMTLLDNVKITFISSLHMMKWGGISYMVPHPCPELYPGLQNVAKRFGIFLRKRPGTMLAPGVMLAEYLQPARNWVRHWAAGNRHLEPIQGCDSYEYVQVINPDAFILIPECCIWYDPRMLDDRPSGTSLGAALEYAAEVTGRAQAFVERLWDEAQPHLATETPWRKMVGEKMQARLDKHTNVSDPPFRFGGPEMAREITVAEKIGIEGHDDIYRMFDLGGMYKLLEEEHKATGDGTIGRLRDEAYAQLLEYDRFLHANYEVVNTPIRNLVGMGIGALLEGSRYASGLER